MTFNAWGDGNSSFGAIEKVNCFFTGDNVSVEGGGMEGMQYC